MVGALRLHQMLSACESAPVVGESIPAGYKWTCGGARDVEGSEFMRTKQAA